MSSASSSATHGGVDVGVARREFATRRVPARPSTVRAKIDVKSPHSNIPDSIRAFVGRDLHRVPDHPLCIVRERIERWFGEHYVDQSEPFETFDDLDPYVTVEANFDVLLTPKDHVSRSKNDTYYADAEHVLRCHTSAHQVELMRAGHKRFLVAGDVYRCDTVDSTHFPVFHQMEGVRLFSTAELARGRATLPHGETSEHILRRFAEPVASDVAFIERDMKQALEQMVKALFGDVRTRWVPTYFPFTEPSWELEIWFRDEWLEVLGCGVIEQQIVEAAGRHGHRGWAFGIGLERIAMALFRVPDIRLFWSGDERFLRQFAAHRTQRELQFVPYSKYPPGAADVAGVVDVVNGARPVWHDVSFWLPASEYHVNKLHELVRDLGGDLVEDVRVTDEFVNPTSKRTSNTVRITYRHMDRSLTNAEIDVIQDRVRARMVSDLKVELRER